MSIETMKLALDALEVCVQTFVNQRGLAPVTAYAAMEALRKEIAQPALTDEQINAITLQQWGPGAVFAADRLDQLEVQVASQSMQLAHDAMTIECLTDKVAAVTKDAVLAEREACAMVCDHERSTPERGNVARFLGQLIRGRANASSKPQSVAKSD